LEVELGRIKGDADWRERLERGPLSHKIYRGKSNTLKTV
jgi:hypothetical protein